MGCCIKPKIRSAYDQQERNPTSTPTTEKMIRFLNSSRCARSGMERVCCARTKTAASAMENFFSPGSVAECRQKSCWGAFPQARYRMQQERLGGPPAYRRPERRIRGPSFDI